MATSSTEEMAKPAGRVSPDIECVNDESQTQPKTVYVPNIESEDDAGKSPRDKPGDVPEIHVEFSDEQCMRHLERRLSCQELQVCLDQLTKLRETPIVLPENKGSVLECRFLKTLETENAYNTIDEAIDETRVWLEQLRNFMKRHVDSHRFNMDNQDGANLRKHGSEAGKNRTDSGICSQELPPHVYANQGQASNSDDDSKSWDCNQCECSYNSCRCTNLSNEEVRREHIKPRQGSKRLAIVSFSQIPTAPTDQNLRAETTRFNYESFGKPTDLSPVTQFEKPQTLPTPSQLQKPYSPSSAAQPEEPKTSPFTTQFNEPVTQLKEPQTSSAATQLKEPQTSSAATQLEEPQTSTAATQLEEPQTSSAATRTSSTATQLEEPQTSSAATQLEEPQTSSAATQLEEPQTSSAATQLEEPQTSSAATQLDEQQFTVRL